MPSSCAAKPSSMAGASGGAGGGAGAGSPCLRARAQGQSVTCTAVTHASLSLSCLPTWRRHGAPKGTSSTEPALATQKCKLLQPKAVKDRSAWAPPSAARHTWKRQAS